MPFRCGKFPGKRRVAEAMPDMINIVAPPLLVNDSTIHYTKFSAIDFFYFEADDHSTLTGPPAFLCVN